MNSLILFLEAENNLTLSRLKQLYRELSKKTHPDTSEGKGFLELKKEYDEARELLRRGYKSTSKEDETKNPRKTFMGALYLYSIKFPGIQSGPLLDLMISAARLYDKELYGLLLKYKEKIFQPYFSIRDQKEFYFAHSLLISTMTQLHFYFSYNRPGKKRLMENYLKDLEARSYKVENPEWASIIRSLGRWIGRLLPDL